MSDIDDKLYDILWEAKEREVSVTDTIAQIKQAFAEANYIEIPDDSQEVEALAAWHSGVLLTGQEWLDKFLAEADKGEKWIDTGDYFKALEAAKRAAGLTE